ncbi:MAG: hypothetical protein ACK4TB_14370 [Gemmobacter sp.]
MTAGMAALPADLRLTYGFDPLCGWCYGIVPAMRALMAAQPGLPVNLAMPGLVTGARVGPYAAMEGYIRGASQRLSAVTGRAPSPAFYDLIRRPGVTGDSAPPVLVLAAARAVDPAAAVRLAHRITEAHFDAGADLNDPATYPPLLAAEGIAMALPDLADRAAAAAVFAADARFGIAAFPTLIARRGARAVALPPVYAPDALQAALRDAAAAL